MAFSELLCHLSFILVQSAIAKIPWSGWLVNNRNVFLIVQEAGYSRSRSCHMQCAVRPRVLVHRQPSPFLICTWKKELKGSLGLFWKGTNPGHELLEAPPCNSVRVVVSFQHRNFRGTCIQSTAPFLFYFLFHQYVT